MRCDEIKESLVEILYDESGTSSTNVELREHLRTCSACRRELEDLRQTQKILRVWKDESPIRSTVIARRTSPLTRNFHWNYLRYAAAAAMILVAFLALANTQITWNKDGFSFSTQLFGRHETEKDFYTKAELRSILKRALDESEFRTNETNYLMVQKILDTVEQDRWNDLRLIRHKAPQVQNGN